MRLSLQTVVEELQRLKLAGQSTVSVSEETLARLHKVIDAQTVAAAAAEEAAPAPLARPPAPRAPAGSQATSAPRPRAESPSPRAGGTPPSDPAARPTSAPSSGAAPTPAAAQAQPGPAQADPSSRPPAPSTGPSVLEAYLSSSKAPQAPKPAETPAAHFPPAPELSLPEGDKATRMAWLLERARNDSVAKSLLRPGKRAVLGTGSLDARLFLISDAPSADEENEVAPQPGSSGELLARMLQGMGLKREEVYLANILTWRPQGSQDTNSPIKETRDPNLHEMAYSLPFLAAQIEIVRPELLVVFGATATKGLLGNAFKTLFDARGRWHSFHGLPLMVTYHPNYLLHKATEGKLAEKKAKRSVWEDLLKVMEKAELPISEKQRGYFL